MKTYIQIFLVALTAVALSCSDTEDLTIGDYNSYAIPNDTSLAHPKAMDLEALMEEKVRLGLPGLSISVITPDGHHWTGAAGKADLYNNIDLQPGHQMMVASVSKVFTATCVFLLQEEGLLSLDDKLSDHLEGEYMDKIKNAKKVTIRQLLNHTSGLYDYLNPLKYELISIDNPYKSDTPEKKLELAYNKKPDHEPGKTYSYSNTNFVLLGLLVEELSGMPLEQFEQSNIFTPLGLQSAYAGTTANPLPPGVPKGYLSINANNVLRESEFYYHYDLATGDGNIGINMYELSIFMKALHNEEIINAASLQEMKEEFDLPEDWQGDYHLKNGNGLEIFETDYGTAYGHTGAIVGFLTTAWYFPESGVSIMFSTNGVSPKILNVREDLTEEILDLVFE